jgi:HD-GYP domain-containing protein (c-di-GMP phosphodiesterase class II)
VRTDRKGRPSDREDPTDVDWKDRVVRADREARIIDFLPRKPVEHADTVAVEVEFEVAHDSRRRICEALDEVVDDIRRERKVAVEGLREAVGEMTDSIVRNPDACMWLRMAKNRESYTYYHLLDTSALAIALGRHLGFSRTEIGELGLGALLIDIGKLKVPQDLIRKTAPLSDAEHAEVRRHVAYSVEILKGVPGVTRRTMEIVAAHHERYDGSGYPEGLFARRIPPFARMVAVADCFDAITSDRPYRVGISPHDAMRQLYDECDRAFQREIVEQFIQCLGIYPTGTLVELVSGEIGVVVGQNRLRRLKPRLLLLLDAQHNRLDPCIEVDLMEPRPKDCSGSPCAIRRSVEPQQFGINLRQLYLAQDRLCPAFLRNLSTHA